MSVIKTADADGVANLFKIDDYNVSGYISNYVKELQGEYYTQRWYIYTVDSGKKKLPHIVRLLLLAQITRTLGLVGFTNVILRKVYSSISNSYHI